MFLKQIHDSNLSQYAYLIGCAETGEALLVDPERDIDRYRPIAEENDLTITHVAETHIHADFLSGTRQFLETDDEVHAYLSAEGGSDWQYEWATDHDRVSLLKHGDQFSIGNVKITALHTPGHTPEHLCFLITDGKSNAEEPMALLSGDFVFVGDVGRPDLFDTAAGESDSRESAARSLFASLEQIRKLGDHVLVLPGHGSGSSCGKALGSVPFSTVGYERLNNEALLIAEEKGEEAFVEFVLDGQPEPPKYFARMKKWNRDGAPVLSSLPEPNRLSASALTAIISKDPKNLAILDTRQSRTDFMKSHLTGSLFTPLGDKFLEAAGSYVDHENDLYLIVENESDIPTAVRELVRIGLDNVKTHAVWSEIEEGDTCRDWMRSTPTIDVTEIDPTDRVLDVRSAGEFQQGHVPNAHHLPHTRLVADHDQLPEPGPLTVHCGSGMRAALAVAQLERDDYQVTFANGTFADWKENAEQIETGAA